MLNKKQQISLICENTDTCDWSRYDDYTVIANALTKFYVGYTKEPK